MTISYNNPAGGSPSSIGPQDKTNAFIRNAIFEAVKEQYFQPLADVTTMPRHSGKKIKVNHYMPLLSDANINDQGINAAGVSGDLEKTIVIFHGTHYNDKNGMFAVGVGANSGAATTAAETKAIAIFTKLGIATGTYAVMKAAAIAAGLKVNDTAAAVPNTGNLYGSSKDVGTIVGKLPMLGEAGGRVNRVGFRRIEIEGEIHKMGIFDEYTQDSLNFDTDDQLLNHINRTMIDGASEITEDSLQIDLLNGAGVIRYPGVATSNATISGETGGVTEVSYEDIMRLGIDLDNNRCPKHTTRVTGSLMTDTRTIDGARLLFIGSELIPTIARLKDLHGEPAFIPAHKYGAATQVLRGEIGSIDQFRIIVVPEMMHWAGVGASVTTNAGYRASAGKYDVFPMLVVGDKSFTCVGFLSDGKTFKFQIKHQTPDQSMGYLDPYAETGRMSIKWWHGTLILRPERIALLKTVARN